MNRMDEMFQKRKEKGEKSLITFVTAGDPDIKATYDLVLAMENAGADLIELGVPYSDPIAEGPVIQSANIRALKNDVRMDTLFELVSKLRKKMQIPLVFLLYLNTILQYGKAAFFERCKEVGLDGVVIPDLPFEESEEIHKDAKAQNVYLIRLVAPTSKDRIKKIAEKAEGFLYCVSSLGVTGTRQNFSTDFESFFTEIDRYKTAPSAVGFGISTPEQVKVLKKYCDGVIVGSAIVKLIESAKNTAEAVQKVEGFVKELKAAVNN